MTLSDIAIRRSVAAWMLMAGLIVFGTISMRRMGISQLPDYDFPVLNVHVMWPGSAPEVIEAELVDRLEQALVSVQGLREISSTMRQGQANITMEFDINRDVDAALQEVQSKISGVRMPKDVDPPTIQKVNPDDQPIMWLGVSSQRPLRDLIVYTDLYLRDRFQIVPGVGEVLLGGFAERNLRVWVDNEKLKQYELTVLDVRKAIEREHYESAAGIVENSINEINIRSMGEGLSAEQVGDIILTQRGGRPIYTDARRVIRLKEVARIEDGLNDIRRMIRMQGVPGVGMGIKKQRGENTVAVANRIKERMAEIRKVLPEDIKIEVNFDSTVFIKESIDETRFTLVLSAIVTGLVCLVFLGSWESTFNVLLSIPTSIMGTFMAMYFMGFTLNMFTLLGLALAIGIVVDDAIMVLENIVRHYQMGKHPMEAARAGTSEITLAATAATLAVVAVFLPVAFMTGIIGKFLYQFGVTITAAVLLSLLEAITLTPMRCSRIMSPPDEDTRMGRLSLWIFSNMASWYRASLGLFLNWRWTVVLSSLVLFASSMFLVKWLRMEFLPPQDQSMFMVRYQTAVGSSLAFTAEKIKPMEKWLMEQQEVRRCFASIGGFEGGEVNTGIFFVTLHPMNKRKATQEDVMDRFRQEAKKYPDIKFYAQDLSMRGFTAQRGFPIEINIRGQEWGVLDRASRKIVEEINKSGLMIDVDTDYRLGQPEARVIPDRQKAAESGVSMQTIGETVEAAMGGVREGKFTKDGRRYDVRIRLEPGQRSQTEQIAELQVRTDYGEIMPITRFVEVENVDTLQTITRRSRERSISIFANVAKGKSQAAALTQALEIARKNLPEGYAAHTGGGAATFRDSFASLKFVLIMGILVSYMILGAQFNSFVHSFTVLLAMPFSISGAFFGLWLTNQSLNLYSFIGIVMLLGIVKKNSILLVEFTNQIREKKKLDKHAALLEGCPLRLRPVLMTSFATIAAAIPPALAMGPGAESRIPMAVTIIGGVLISSIFTLIVVPCFYSLVDFFNRPFRVVAGEIVSKPSKWIAHVLGHNG